MNKVVVWLVNGNKLVLKISDEKLPYFRGGLEQCTVLSTEAQGFPVDIVTRNITHVEYL